MKELRHRIVKIEKARKICSKLVRQQYRRKRRQCIVRSEKLKDVNAKNKQRKKCLHNLDKSPVFKYCKRGIRKWIKIQKRVKSVVKSSKLVVKKSKNVCPTKLRKEYRAARRQCIVKFSKVKNKVERIKKRNFCFKMLDVSKKFKVCRRGFNR